MNLKLTLLILLIALFFLSLSTGHTTASFSQGITALYYGDGPLGTVMRQIRLPRAILAMLVGASLGVCGAALQGYLRNPLAEPGLIGVSGSAALGAVISLQTGFATYVWMGLPIAAFSFATLAVLLLLLLAGPRGSSLTLILAGAFTSLALNLSPNPYATSEIVFWLMGSLADRSFEHVWLALPFCVIGWLMIGSIGKALDALTLGEDVASSLSISLTKTKLLLVFGVASSVGAATAVCGAIGFVGLVVPHLLRPLVKGKPSTLLLVSGLGGAIMVLAADIAVRVILPDRDLKLGVLMAIIGAPLFLHLIYKTRSALQ
jgi:iron complex transport system permease protein